MSGSPANLDRVLREAETALAQGRLDHALQLLGHGLRHDAHDRRLYDLAARVVEQRGDRGRQGVLFRLCADHFEDARPFYDLGFEFMNADLPHLARPVLERAATLAPGDLDIQVECAVAQAESGRHDRALTTLEALPPARRRDHGSVAFLEAWCRLLTGDVDRAEAALDRWRTEPPARQPDPTLAERLRLAVARFRAWGPPGGHDLRAWHFIQYGGAIVSTSATPAMGGRFGLLTERHEDLAARLGDLEGLLRDLAFPVSVIATPDHPDSEVLGRVLAKRFRVPRVPFDSGARIRPGTVLCLSTVDDAPDPAGLVRRDPDLLVYTHRLSWTRSAPFTPDIVGLVAEAHFLPWHRTFRFDATEKKVVERPPDTSPPPRIAAHVYRHMPDPPGRGAAPWRDAYVRHRALALYGAGSALPARPAFRQESPVPGRRFL